MTFLPILTPWVFWPLAVLLLAATAYLLLTSRSAARWRYALLVVLVLLAGARPGLVGASAPVATTDLNVFFVLDVTPSSSAEDYNGNDPRLEGMKADINALATELAGARYSLITFDSNAKVVLPLTTDATALQTLTQVLTPKSSYASQGSSISVAAPLLADRLAASQKSHPTRPRLVFYLGDGEQTASKAPAPFAQGTDLIDGGAVLGYGTAAGGKMRDHTFGADAPGNYILDKSAAYEPAISRIDEKALGSIAQQLHLPYVHRGTPANIAAALSDSAPKAAMQSAGFGEQAGAGRRETYWLLALAAFGVVVWEVLLLSAAYRQLQRPRQETP
ncbi:VWA domain-containing protein [Arthrobacter sp. HLT1-20]